MPKNYFFIIGDLLANGSSGFLAAICCYWLVDASWMMPLAMILSMVVGMAVATIAALLVFMRYFGAMEIMLPSMISGMCAGMIIGMRATIAPLSFIDASLYGLLIGLMVTAICWAVNDQLRGKEYHG